MTSALEIPAHQHRVRGYLDRLGAIPPLSLLLEGGAADERVALARYWAARLNCQDKAATSGCLTCPSCVQVLTDSHRDVVTLDGRQGDIKIDPVRELIPLMGEPPRGGGTRVITLLEAQAVLPQAANTLLKSMEEPGPGTVFVLTAPQRERLLPTLVSRSMVLTLAWPQVSTSGESGSESIEGEADPAEIEVMAAALWGFMHAGRGWYEHTSARPKLEVATARAVVTACRRRLVLELGASVETGGNVSAAMAASLDAALEHALEALEYRVGPALTLDWLASAMRRVALNRGR